MENLKENIENNKENQKITVFPTVEQIMNDLQFQFSTINSSENKLLKSNGKSYYKLNKTKNYSFFFIIVIK